MQTAIGLPEVGQNPARPRPRREPASRVFVVEDDLELEVPIRRALRDLDPGLHVEWFAEGTEVYWEICRRPCDLVIADVRLPGGTSGLRLWRLSRLFLPGLPFILMSAMRADRWLERLDAPHPPFLAKPFTMRELRDCVEAMLFSARRAGPRAR